jgi:hypothetical protein
MDLAKSMNILASDRFANYVRTLRPEYRKILHLAGQYPIKHGEKILIYNIYDDNIGNSRSPPQQSHKSAADEEVRQSASRFIFLYAKLELHITDPKTMLTHHTVEWNLLNISQDPILRVFFYTSGDMPRTFPELNMVIKDEEGKELDIMSLNVNEPKQKEFHVKLRKPLQPNEKGRKVRFEWDWEEPKRYYLYTLASDCRKFYYRLVIPKEMEIKQRVLRVHREIGEKTHASVPPAVRYTKDNAEITWNAKNLQVFDAYRFEW